MLQTMRWIAHCFKQLTITNSTIRCKLHRCPVNHLPVISVHLFTHTKTTPHNKSHCRTFSMLQHKRELKQSIQTPACRTHVNATGKPWLAGGRPLSSQDFNLETRLRCDGIFDYQIIRNLLLGTCESEKILTIGRWFVLCGQVSSLLWTPVPSSTFMSVQCASPRRTGQKLVGVCHVCARCVGWRKEQ